MKKVKHKKLKKKLMKCTRMTVLYAKCLKKLKRGERFLK